MAERVCVHDKMISTVSFFILISDIKNNDLLTLKYYANKKWE
jgi:hypothetical protein